MISPIFSVIVVVTMLLLATTTTQAYGSGKGLIVHVTINTNLVSQPVYLDAFQFDEFIASYDSYMDNGASETVLKFDKGEVQTGDFTICANAQEGMKQCATGYNSEAKEPTYVTIDMYSNGTPQPVDQGNSQSSANSNNNENTNNNALSQSQETTIWICKEGGCTAQ